MRITQVDPADATALDALADLRAALWPDDDAAAHRAWALEALRTREALALLARADAGEVAGFAEAAIRRDYVNGCDTSPVVFLEGIYVTPAHRLSGVASALVAAVETWGRAHGCTELGSDAFIDDRQSHAFHAAAGFEERERVVCFRKML